jgi:hypothetical protein
MMGKTKVLYGVAALSLLAGVLVAQLAQLNEKQR